MQEEKLQGEEENDTFIRRSRSVANSRTDFLKVRFLPGLGFNYLVLADSSL